MAILLCALCGGNLALVGRAHRCIARGDARSDMIAAADAADAPPFSTSVTHAVTAPRPIKHRAKDPERYRQGHREYMRGRCAQRSQ